MLPVTCMMTAGACPLTFQLSSSTHCRGASWGGGAVDLIPTHTLRAQTPPQHGYMHPTGAFHLPRKWDCGAGKTSHGQVRSQLAYENMLTPHLQVNVAQKRRNTDEWPSCHVEQPPWINSVTFPHQYFQPTPERLSGKKQLPSSNGTHNLCARVCSACVFPPCLLIGWNTQSRRPLSCFVSVPFVVFEALLPLAAGARLLVFPW